MKELKAIAFFEAVLLPGEMGATFFYMLNEPGGIEPLQLLAALGLWFTVNIFITAFATSESTNDPS